MWTMEGRKHYVIRKGLLCREEYSIASACIDKAGGREQVSYTKSKQSETDILDNWYYSV